MSTTDVNSQADDTSTLGHVDFKLEVVAIPVSDVDRSKAFYTQLGWRLDADFGFDNGFRVVQFTPPGSGASVQFGNAITTVAPGTAQGLYLVVSDLEAARAELLALGARVTEVFHPSAPGGQFEAAPPDARAEGMDEHRASYGSFAVLHDPDGNAWLLQEVTTRLPDRVSSDGTGYASVADLADAMRRASVAHGQHEARTGQADPNWPDWYAAYMVAEQAGSALPN
jgi:catechol 2,3-dioxygenase-like lactoylglutathione lyase family enzyme